MNLKPLLDEFLLFNKLADKCTTQKGAYCMCDTVSELFIEFLEKRGIESKMVELCGLPDFPDAHDGWHNNIRMRYDIIHYIVRVGDVYVDWSYKQFDSKANHPYLSTKADLDKIWTEISEI